MINGVTYRPGSAPVRVNTAKPMSRATCEWWLLEMRAMAGGGGWGGRGRGTHFDGVDGASFERDGWQMACAITVWMEEGVLTDCGEIDAVT